MVGFCSLPPPPPPHTHRARGHELVPDTWYVRAPCSAHAWVAWWGLIPRGCYIHCGGPTVLCCAALQRLSSVYCTVGFVGSSSEPSPWGNVNSNSSNHGSGRRRDGGAGDIGVVSAARSRAAVQGTLALLCCCCRRPARAVARVASRRGSRGGAHGPAQRRVDGTALARGADLV